MPPMTLTSSIPLNAVLGLAAVLGVFAVVRFTHRLSDDPQAETFHPSQPLPLSVVLTRHEDEKLAEAA